MPEKRTLVVLLRGINVGGRHRVPMAALRELAQGLGLDDPRTYIQSGNLVCESSSTPAAAADSLEAAFGERFGFEAPMVVVTASAFAKARRACPFPDAAVERPSQVHAGFARSKLPASIAGAVMERATAGETAEIAGEALWIDFPGGVARSKITSALLDRLADGPVTMRNAKTVDRILELCSPR